MTDAADPSPAAPLLVVCLCAAWCGTCRDYEAVFARAAADAGASARFAWVDVEDEADALGDLDIETFPTLLIARGADLLFLGPLTPQAGVLLRTVETAGRGELGMLGAASQGGLVGRVRAVVARAAG